MSNCLRCGSPYEPHHKFCGTCAAPIAPAGAPSAPMPAPGYGAPPAAHAAPPPARCQLGHEIAPGFTYCAQGHPIALEAMQLAGGDAFAAGASRPPSAEPPQAQAPHGYGDGNGPTGAMSPFPHHVAHSAPAHAFPPAAPAPAAPPPAAPGFAPASPSASAIDTAPQAAPGARRLMGFLVSFHGNPLGAFFPLYAGVNRIGRAGAAEGLDVAIADPATSSNHANLHMDSASSRVVLEDLGSTNGTFVNDERLPHAGHRDLTTGDRIRFGSYTAKLLMVPQG